MVVSVILPGFMQLLLQMPDRFNTGAANNQCACYIEGMKGAIH